MYEKALTYFQQAASIRIAALSIDHPDVCATMMKVGLIQVSRRDFDNALVTFAQVLHSRRNAFGYDHPQIVNVLNDIAWCALRTWRTCRVLQGIRGGIRNYAKFGQKKQQRQFLPWLSC
jgi:hypothetical protein